MGNCAYRCPCSDNIATYRYVGKYPLGKNYMGIVNSHTYISSTQINYGTGGWKVKLFACQECIDDRQDSILYEYKRGGWSVK